MTKKPSTAESRKAAAERMARYRANKKKASAAVLAPAAKAGKAAKAEAPKGNGKLGTAEHKEAFKAQGPFEEKDRLSLTEEACPWNEGSNGARFYAKVVKEAETMADALRLGEKAGFSATDTRREMRWLFTWGPFLKVNGKLHAAR
jgi:hypothetical protein